MPNLRLVASSTVKETQSFPDKVVDPDGKEREVLVQVDTVKPADKAVIDSQGLEVAEGVYLVPGDCKTASQRDVGEAIPIFRSPGHPLDGLRLLRTVPSGMPDLEALPNGEVVPVVVRDGKPFRPSEEEALDLGEREELDVPAGSK